MPKALPALVSDGLHYVREASVKDRHPMRFVVVAHRVQGLPVNKALPRHVASLEEGIELIAACTDKAVRMNRSLQCHIKVACANDAETPAKKPTKRKKRTPPARFPITRFVCTMANPVAQVWQCYKNPWETSTIGRRTKSGKAPAGDKLPHLPGDFAVLVGDKPVVDKEGKPKVFKTWMEAEAEMQRLYDEAPDEEKLTDNNAEGSRSTRVYANRTMSVHFNELGLSRIDRRFSIYSDVDHRQLVHPSRDEPWLFSTITSAIEKADELDRQRRGV